MYGDDSSDLDISDILDPIIEEFSIKMDVNLNTDPLTSVGDPRTGKKSTMRSGNKESAKMEELTSYSNLKNNYLGRLSSPIMTTDDMERRSVRDEPTPE